VNAFAGNISNPITEARIKQSLSGPALAKRLGLSRQYVNRVEQGTYSSLNPALLRWTANAMGWTNDSVARRYETFQKVQRQATFERISPHKLTRANGNLSPGGVIFEKWRSGYWNSPTAFAVAFCVHPDLVTKYEEGIQKTMPKQIFKALFQVGLIDKNWVDQPSEVEATDGSLRA
jgi:transcriptional regulator with XRE-family HTH domain